MSGVPEKGFFTAKHPLPEHAPSFSIGDYTQKAWATCFGSWGIPGLVLCKIVVFGVQIYLSVLQLLPLSRQGTGEAVKVVDRLYAC